MRRACYLASLAATVLFAAALRPGSRPFRSLEGARAAGRAGVLSAEDIQAALRADIRRRRTELILLGWLGRAYCAAQPIFEVLRPSFFRLDAYDDAPGCATADGTGRTLSVTLKESSIVGRGIPLSLEVRTGLGPGLDLRSVRLVGIGCECPPAAGRGGAGGAAQSSPTVSEALCRHLNEDRRAKGAFVSAIASDIFSRLARVGDALEDGVALEACAAPREFVPERELWAREGSSEKWLQRITGYYFARATLEEVRFCGGAAPGASFVFYYDREEIVNDGDPSRNINPEVIRCRFWADGGGAAAPGQRGAAGVRPDG